MPTLPFGRTGHISSRAIFRAAALSRVAQAKALIAIGIDSIKPLLTALAGEPKELFFT